MSTLAELEAALAAALDEHTSAKVREDAARRASTKALNDLNAAQRALDKAIAEMRAKQPAESDWGNKRTAAARQVTTF